jgi:hypothetical protein
MPQLQPHTIKTFTRNASDYRIVWDGIKYDLHTTNLRNEWVYARLEMRDHEIMQLLLEHIHYEHLRK